MRTVNSAVFVKASLETLRTTMRKRSQRWLYTVLQLVAVAAASACAGAPDSQPITSPLTDPAITVAVRNDRLERVVILVQYDRTTPRRVGVVGIGTSQTFTVVWRRAAQVRMIVRSDARGLESFSNRVTVQAGAHLQLIAPQLGRPSLRLLGRS